MLLVQEFLLTHTFGELQEQHAVNVSFSKSGHKWSMNYDQILAKDDNPLSNQCRGLILACKDGRSLTDQAILENGKLTYKNVCPGETVVIARPMDRFFNYGQGAAATIDWSDPKLQILSKIDGTLAIIYRDRFTKQWCMATRSVSEADLLMDNGIYTFRQLFDKALRETIGQKQYWDGFDYFCSGNLCPNYTYCFELTTPLNRVVVNYTDYRITLIAVRDLVTGNELSLDDPRLQQLVSYVPVVKSYSYTSIGELVEWVSSLNPLDHEGVVVKDSNFNRIKIKSPAYTLYNKLHDRLGASPRNCMELILLEKDDDVVPFMPKEIVENLYRIKMCLQDAIKRYDQVYLETVKQANAILSGDKKTFALLITKDKTIWHAPLFSMFAGKCSDMKDFILKAKKDGSWSDGFLDQMLTISGYPSP